MLHLIALGFEAPTAPLIELLRRLDYVQYGARDESARQLRYNRDLFNRWLSEYATVPVMTVLVDDQDEPLWVETMDTRIRVWICCRVLSLHTVTDVDELAQLKGSLTETQKAGLDRLKALLGCKHETTGCYILYGYTYKAQLLE